MARLTGWSLSQGSRNSRLSGLIRPAPLRGRASHHLGPLKLCLRSELRKLWLSWMQAGYHSSANHTALSDWVLYDLHFMLPNRLYDSCFKDGL